MCEFAASPFGTWLMAVFAGMFTDASQKSFATLACGWALSWGRHTVANYLWLTGAVAVKHFTRYYVFLGTALFKNRKELWRRVTRLAAALVPKDQEIIILIDDSTRKKAGRKIEGIGAYRNNAGSARQEYRTLVGLNFVSAVMLVEHRRWPGYQFAVPVGLEVYVQKAVAAKLGRPYFTRTQLAREIVRLVTEALPERQIHVIADGGYATKDFLRELPAAVKATLRFLVSGVLYELPPKQTGRGRRRQKGKPIGSPKTLVRKQTGWSPHPDPKESGTLIQAFDGIWHSVLPGKLIRAVVVKRLKGRKLKKAAGRTPRKEIEAFFTTDTTRSAEDIVRLYSIRWSIEIDFRDAYEFSGLGQDQCRKYERIAGINTLRQVLAAMRTLWFLMKADRGEVVELTHYRPWYLTKRHPSQLDVAWILREHLQAAGLFPIPRFLTRVLKNLNDTRSPHENAG